MRYLSRAKARRMEAIQSYVLYFFFYSVLGWLYEVFLEVVVYRWGFTNRGVLLGPYCPVYGVGALVFLLCFSRLMAKQEPEWLRWIRPVLIFLGCMIIPAIYADAISGVNPLAINAKPSAEHWLGADRYGHDVFIKAWSGGRMSFLVGLVAAFCQAIIGVLIGSISGYCGGKVDLIMMRIVDIIYSLPDTLMVILLSVVLNQVLGNALKGTILAQVGTNMLSLFVVFGLLYWVSMARLVRGQILSIKTNEYVLAARALGAKPGRIIRKHILPNCISVIFISVALQIPSAIFTESFLSFIGLGVQAPMPSLGSLANAARGGMQNYPWKMLFPALSICLIVLSFNLLGDGLRDAFDPKLRR